MKHIMRNRNRNYFEYYINGKELEKGIEYEDLLEMKEKRYKRKKSNFKKEYKRKYS